MSSPVGHPVPVVRHDKKQGKGVRVLAGVMLMIAIVVILLAIVLRNAGAWGVPFFSFESDRGSDCKNSFTGYTCESLTVEDIEWYGDVNLPADTSVVTSSYTATHDYELVANLEISKKSSAAGYKALRAAYGKCVAGHFTPLDTNGLKDVCVMANDQVTEGGTPSGRIFNVGTGVRKDGVRVVALSVKSR